MIRTSNAAELGLCRMAADVPTVSCLMSNGSKFTHACMHAIMHFAAIETAMGQSHNVNLHDHGCSVTRLKYAMLPGLEPYTEYAFRLRASNMAGASDWSKLVWLRSGAATPSCPLDVQSTGGIPMLSAWHLALCHTW